MAARVWRIELASPARWRVFREPPDPVPYIGIRIYRHPKYPTKVGWGVYCWPLVLRRVIDRQLPAGPAAGGATAVNIIYADCE